MKKLTVSFLLTIVFVSPFALQAQDKSSYNTLFEASANLAHYIQVPVPFAAIDLRYGSVTSDLFAMGMLASGYTTTASLSVNDSMGNTQLSLHGFHVGAFARFHSHNTLGHFYFELQATYGRMWITGSREGRVGKGQALEYAGGFSIGYNYHFGRGIFFNLNSGLRFGTLNTITGVTSSAPYMRSNFGLGFQKRFRVD